MATALFNGVVIARSNETEIVEGNHYFPPESVNREYFADSDKTTVCGWKGTANYYDVSVDAETSPAAAWYYATPSEAARKIANYVAFGRDVRVEG